MRVLVKALAFSVFFSALPVAAQAEPCMGYQNAMSALEMAVADAQSPRAAVAGASNTRRVTSVPPIESINQSIDELEAAIVAHREQNALELTPRRIKP